MFGKAGGHFSCLRHTSWFCGITHDQTVTMSASPSSRGTKRAAPDASVSAPKRRAASAESAESLAANIAKAKELKLVATCLICLDPNRVASASCDTPQCVWGVCFKCHSESDGTQMPPSCVCKKPIRSQIPKLRKHRPMLQGRPNGCGCGGQIWQVKQIRVAPSLPPSPPLKYCVLSPTARRTHCSTLLRCTVLE